jgi:hypothetical protein
MVNPFRAIRQFERFLFKGVPERPESTWQREINANFTDRYTGKSQLSEQQFEYDTDNWRLISTVIYRPDQEQIEIVREQDTSQGHERSDS